MKGNFNIKYILLSLALFWCGANVSDASTPGQGSTSSRNVPENRMSTEYSFDADSWRSVFQDVRLRELIEQGLERNTDLNVARLRIDQAEASLKAARLATLPSLAISPSASVSSLSGSQTSKTSSLPLQASWQVDLFGRLRNAKRQQKMLVESSKAYQQAVQVNLVANIARQYYTCALLDTQLSIARQSVDVWDETVRAMKAFMEEGQYTDAAVSQAEASREQVKATVLDLQQQKREALNAIRVFVGDSTNSVSIAFDTEGQENIFLNSVNLDTWQAIPLQRLSCRPDVCQAEMNLAASVYATKEARAAFYPTITLSGTAGWTNPAGVVVNPEKILLEALASLTQPIFQNGSLKANLAIKKSQQEEARLQFQQSLLNAGVEVNNALTQAQTYSDKSSHLESQVKALERTVRSTLLLQQNGSSNYLEVLTAQENLLSARMSKLQNEYNRVAALIALYQAVPSGECG